MNRVRSGELPWTKLDRLHRMTLDGLLAKFKIEGLTEDEKAHFNKAWHRLRGWPDAVAGLTRLKTRFVIAPLSNGNVSLLTDMAKFAGLPWDVILSTELVRRYKPDKDTYLMPVEFWDLEPANVMMVAAHTGDLKSAKALGLRTAYVHRPLENGGSRPPTPPPAAGTFDFTANDFRDLAAQLGV
jgi:2-haloacid dehalogenase